jgi:hypothetical protein
MLLSQARRDQQVCIDVDVDVAVGGSTSTQSREHSDDTSRSSSPRYLDGTAVGVELLKALW